MTNLDITCENGALTIMLTACGGTEKYVIFAPLRIYDISGNATQVFGSDGKSVTFSNDSEITFDGNPITAQDLQAGITDGTLCGATSGGSDCCDDVAEILMLVNNYTRTLNMISAEVTENNGILTATQPIIEGIAACCAANTAAIADLLQVIQCGENPVPEIVSVDGVVTSSVPQQVGSLLTVNGFNFTSDFSVVFSDAEIQITSLVFVSSTEIRIGVIGGSNAGTSDINIVSNFPDGCPATNSGTSGVGLIETVEVTTERVQWLGTAPNLTVLATDNKLTKVSGGNSWTNGGAYGGRCLAGNGYLEFVIPVTTGTINTFMCGLNSDASAGSNWSEIDFAIYENNGTLRVYESGTFRATIGTFAPATVVRITVAGTTVTYSVGGTVLFTSPSQPIFPLCPDATMFREGSQLSNAIISGILA